MAPAGVEAAQGARRGGGDARQGGGQGPSGVLGDPRPEDTAMGASAGPMLPPGPHAAVRSPLTAPLPLPRGADKSKAAKAAKAVKKSSFKKVRRAAAA